MSKLCGGLRKRYTKQLYIKQAGLCAICLRFTGIANELLSAGWVMDSLALNLYSPDQKYALPVASLDHIQRQRHGGDNSINNLRLVCVECNQERN